ncbi:FkbM family methyltransferase [Gloeocapsa sp. BRSZ]
MFDIANVIKKISLFDTTNYRTRVSTIKKLPIGTDQHIYTSKLADSSRIEVIFDIGANIGQTATKFAQSFPKAKIFSFEPVAATFKQLKENTQKNSSISCFQIGLGTESGKHKIFLNSNSQCNSFLFDANNRTNDVSEEVFVKTIEQFCEENSINKIDILKTDTEGFDLKVIQGAEALLKKQQILFILSEVGFHPSDTLHTNFFQLKLYLEQFNFEFIGFYDFGYSKKGSLKYCNALFQNKHLNQNTETSESFSKSLANLST